MRGRNPRGATAPGSRARECRDARGLNRVQIAARSGLGLPVIDRLERGPLGGVTVRTLLLVSRALGVRPIDLIPALAARYGQADPLPAEAGPEPRDGTIARPDVLPY